MTTLVATLETPRIELDDYVQKAIALTDPEHAELGVIDPVTAARLIVKTADSGVLQPTTLVSLKEIAGENDKDRIPNRMLPAALRVIGDFQYEESVVLQQETGAPYKSHKLFALDEQKSKLGILNLAEKTPNHWYEQIEDASWLVASSNQQTITLIDPAYSGLFLAQDYENLVPDTRVKRNANFFKAAKFALGLSCFSVLDRTENTAEALEDNMRRYVAQLRHFEIFYKTKRPL